MPGVFLLFDTLYCSAVQGTRYVVFGDWYDVCHSEKRHTNWSAYFLFPLMAVRGEGNNGDGVVTQHATDRTSKAK